MPSFKVSGISLVHTQRRTADRGAVHTQGSAHSRSSWLAAWLSGVSVRISSCARCNLRGRRPIGEGEEVKRTSADKKRACEAREDQERANTLLQFIFKPMILGIWWKDFFAIFTQCCQMLANSFKTKIASNQAMQSSRNISELLSLWCIFTPENITLNFPYNALLKTLKFCRPQDKHDS